MRKLKKKLKHFWKNFKTVLKRPEMNVLPGSFAYYLVLSIVPTITLITYAASFFNVPSNFIFEFLAKALNEDIANLVVANFGGTALGMKFYVSLIMAILIASNGASSIITTSNAIYGIKNTGFLKRRLKALIMTAFLILLIIFMLAVPVFGDKIIELINYVNLNAKFTEQISVVFNFIRGPISWFIIFVLVKILYTMAPDRLLPSKYVNYGAIFTSITWVIITSIFSYYISHIAVYDVFYGGLANIVILMLWFYLLAYIFTIGMALNYREEEIKLEKTSQINIVE
ncbi:MAG: YihY/virulence factor BrkB family protein [Bacilli bacterium]|nr:YihY/virulence factor BrkB family protein [Bacilli bacterium]